MVGHPKKWSKLDAAEDVSYEMTKDQAKWWEEEGRKQYPGICFAESDDHYADFVIVFGHLYTTYVATGVVPQTSATQVSGDINGSPIYGTIYTTENKAVVRRYGMEFTAIRIYDYRRVPLDTTETEKVPLLYDSTNSKRGFFAWKTRRADDRAALEGALSWIRDNIVQREAQVPWNTEPGPETKVVTEQESKGVESGKGQGKEETKGMQPTYSCGPEKVNESSVSKANLLVETSETTPSSPGALGQPVSRSEAGRLRVSVVRGRGNRAGAPRR